MPITTNRGGRAAAWRRIAWFVGLWLTGVLTVTIVSGVLRWVLHSG